MGLASLPLLQDGKWVLEVANGFTVDVPEIDWRVLGYVKRGRDGVERWVPVD